jgi:hypothetical protein
MLAAAIEVRPRLSTLIDNALFDNALSNERNSSRQIVDGSESATSASSQLQPSAVLPNG